MSAAWTCSLQRIKTSCCALSPRASSSPGLKSSKGQTISTGAFSSAASALIRLMVARIQFLSDSEKRGPAKYILMSFKGFMSLRLRKRERRYFFNRERFPVVPWLESSHSRSALLMRLCHPLPMDLKVSTTSASSRIFTGTFFSGDLGRPRGFSSSAARFHPYTRRRARNRRLSGGGRRHAVGCPRRWTAGI